MCSVWHIHIHLGWHAKRCAACDVSTSFLWAQRQKFSVWHIHRRFPWPHSQKPRCDIYRRFLLAYSRKCLSQWPHGLRRGSADARLLILRFRIPPGQGCLSLVSGVCCQVEVFSSGWLLGQRSPTDCGVSECDREASIMRRPWLTGGCCTMGKEFPRMSCGKSKTFYVDIMTEVSCVIYLRQNTGSLNFSKFGIMSGQRVPK